MTLKQFGKDVGTMVVLAVSTTIVFGALILAVYVWPYVLATLVMAVGIIAWFRR